MIDDYHRQWPWTVPAIHQPSFSGNLRVPLCLHIHKLHPMCNSQSCADSLQCSSRCNRCCFPPKPRCIFSQWRCSRRSMFCSWNWRSCFPRGLYTSHKLSCSSHLSTCFRSCIHFLRQFFFYKLVNNSFSLLLLDPIPPTYLAIDCLNLRLSVFLVIMIPWTKEHLV